MVPHSASLLSLIMGVVKLSHTTKEKEDRTGTLNLDLSGTEGQGAHEAHPPADNEQFITDIYGWQEKELKVCATVHSTFKWTRTETVSATVVAAHFLAFSPLFLST